MITAPEKTISPVEETPPREIPGSAETPWHALPTEEVTRLLETGIEDGLTEQQAAERLEKYGENTLETDGGTNLFSLVFKQINNPLIYLLLAAAIVSLVTNHFIDAGVIFGVIILNSILGVVQEFRAERALEALRKMASTTAKVLRDGVERRIEAMNVVPGDILLLELGESVAADARVFKEDDLELNESALTGESEPVAKEAIVLDPDISLADRINMVYMSTAVTAGRGRAIVVNTGRLTEMGVIASEVSRTTREETPLQRRVAKLGTVLGVAAVLLAAVVFILGIFRGYVALEMMIFSVAVAVSAIPEGLPAAISVVLALGVQRMSKKNAIIRRLPAVETLGSTTVICTDKTGTITENKMTVRKIWTNGTLYDVTGLGYTPEGNIAPEGDTEHVSPETTPVELQILSTIGVLANNAQPVRQDNTWTIEGSPTEGAIVVAAMKAGVSPEHVRQRTGRLDEIPFSSAYKYMAVLYPLPDKENVRVYVKGAPEKLIAFSSHVLENGKPIPLDDDRRARLKSVNEHLASQALRVVAGAYRDLPPSWKTIENDEVETGLTLVGFWGIIDPARAEAAEAITRAKEAGIRVVMLTGDHALTASAIAGNVGISDKSATAVTGKDLENKSPEEIARLAKDVGVFARVSPAHKLTILNALKEDGQIVAMTGDGVNDAPALKGADIGIAMGRSGTEVAKEAADMILTDDNFATIVNAVETGRAIFNNLQRVIFYLLTTNLSEILILSAVLMLGLPLPLTAIMILWINLVTDGACTIPLGVESSHSDVLKQPPRNPKIHIVDKIFLYRLAILAPVITIGSLGLFYYELQVGDLRHAQTITFATLAAFQWFQAFNARSIHDSIFAIGWFTNKWLVAGVGIAIALQLLIIYTSWGQLLFGTTPLSLTDWVIITLVASSVLIVDEIMKKLNIYRRLSQE